MTKDATAKPKRRRVRNPLERVAIAQPIAVDPALLALPKAQREAIARGLTSNLRTALGLDS